MKAMEYCDDCKLNRMAVWRYGAYVLALSFGNYLRILEIRAEMEGVNLFEEEEKK